jgi:hypothetical protein
MKPEHADYLRLRTNPRPEAPPAGTVDLFYDATANTVRVRRADNTTITFGGGSATWGGIDGTIGDQTDLTNALADKVSLTMGGTIEGTLVIDNTIEFTDNVVVSLSSGAKASWLDELGLTDWSGLNPTSYVAKSAVPVTIGLAVSDETTALTTGTGKLTFRMPHAMTVTAVRASVTTAPTGSTLIVNVKKNGTTIFSTNLSIDASEKTSTTAASAAVISVSALADDDEITIDIVQIGSSVAGAGLKIWLIGTRAT